MEKRLLAAAPAKTVALMVTEADVKSDNLPSQLSAFTRSAEFKADLTMSQSAWAYTNDDLARRVLLLQYKAEKDGNSALAMRKLGALAATQLQAKKVNDVELIASASLDKDLMGVFHNSFALSNYEYTEKTAPEKSEEEVTDERLNKWRKTIDSFEVSHESLDKEGEEFKFQAACVRATEFARNLANVRGSEADPTFVEEYITDLLDAHSLDENDSCITDV
jgi:leucyl aminopeptidase